jgi:predicted MFS family arabinose efflux permease
MAPPPGRAPLFTRAFVLLGVADLAYFTCVGVALVALPLYVTGPVGSDEAGAGVAFGIFAVTSLACRPFAGRYSDRLGRRPLLVLGAVLAAVGMLLMPYADTLALVVVLRLVQGVGEAAFFVSGFAMLADISPPERMGEALSYNSLGLYLGLALGPPLGELLLDRGGFTAAWVGGGVMAALAGLLVLALPEPPRTGESDAEGHGRLIHRPALPLTLGFLASLVGVSGYLAFVALHSEEIGMESASLALFVYGCVVIFCRVAFARVPDRLPTLPLAAGSLVVQGFGLLLIAVWQQPAGLLVGTVVAALGITFVTPTFFTAIFATARPSERGAASGTASAALDLGLGLGPILLGLVAREQGLPWVFAVAAAAALAGAAWTAYLAVGRRPVRA